MFLSDLCLIAQLFTHWHSAVLYAVRSVLKLNIELTISDHTDSGSALLLNAQALRPGNPACWKMFELQIQIKHLNQQQWEFLSCFWTVVGRKREALTTRELSSSHTNSSTWHLINSQTHAERVFIYSLILSYSSDVWNPKRKKHFHKTKHYPHTCHIWTINIQLLFAHRHVAVNTWCISIIFLRHVRMWAWVQFSAALSVFTDLQWGGQEA